MGRPGVHFVGMGGAGMSGLPWCARTRGRGDGSDRAPDSPYLESPGIAPAVGHDAANVPGGAELVVPSAIPAENPERAAAGSGGCVTCAGPTCLGRSPPAAYIAVTGTHGKTTTSSMVVHALRGCGLDPGYLVGGEVRSTGANAGWGAGEWLVVEADESDRSLLKLPPRIAVLTNAELDHHATYAPSATSTRRSARSWRWPSEVVLGDEPEPRALRRRASRGRSDVALEPRRLALHASTACPSTLPVPGAHNARNAAAALAACRLAGADRRAAAAALPTSAAPAGASSGSAPRRGARRWSTTTRTTRPRSAPRSPPPARWSPRRVVAVFQPHLFSRTRHQFARVRRRARARRPRRRARRLPGARARRGLPGRDGRLVAAAAADARGGPRVAWLPGFDDAERFLRAELREGDLLLTLGAGNVDALGAPEFARLARGPAAGRRTAAG